MIGGNLILNITLKTVENLKSRLIWNMKLDEKFKA
jgi:hypothetical protein